MPLLIQPTFTLSLSGITGRNITRQFIVQWPFRSHHNCCELSAARLFDPEVGRLMAQTESSVHYESAAAAQAMHENRSKVGHQWLVGLHLRMWLISAQRSAV